MPFTPYHMGPGALIKATMGRHFSLLVFGWSQIVMDIQPLVAILQEESILHGWSHTYLGAVGLGLVAGIIGRYGLIALAKIVGIQEDSWMGQYCFLSWKTALLSAWIGTLSHVWLDSLMHWDMQPFFPSPQTSSLLGVFSNPVIYNACLVTGAIGGGIALWRERLAGSSTPSSKDWA